MCFFGTQFFFGGVDFRRNYIGERFNWDILGAYSVDSVEFLGGSFVFQ